MNAVPPRILAIPYLLSPPQPSLTVAASPSPPVSYASDDDDDEMDGEDLDDNASMTSYDSFEEVSYSRRHRSVPVKEPEPVKPQEEEEEEIDELMDDDGSNFGPHASPSPAPTRHTSAPPLNIPAAPPLPPHSTTTERITIIRPAPPLPARGTYRVPGCSVCGKRFTSLARYKSHMLSHTGVKPFACSACGQEFNRRDSCVRHIGFAVNARETDYERAEKHMTAHPIKIPAEAGAEDPIDA
ncbi:hypothetical protein EXIGLDRAFT_686010 [Exidia glandulosa HHB12029]|uniref:C2H2-type domain-containing protein n=1 Tax=Exidia glandulosa HHB12029 TaxID=1314781 RepID=A0A165ZCF1_EXIGL|nr:hypothetical protein EXIGLDRAFT_686010 [Exidia glandulosa HHB12029]